MPVIDELYIRNGTNRVPVDSIDNKAIEEIVINDQIYHFAKESAASGVNSVVCENAVNEPFRSIEAIGDTAQSILPLEYQQIEYLRSTGTQYIDTGVIPDNETGFSIDMSLDNMATDRFLFGCRQDSGEYSRFVLGVSQNIYFGFGMAVNNLAKWKVNINTFFNAKLNFLNSRVANVNDNNDLGINPLKVAITYSIIMFGRNSAGSISSSAQTIKACKISQGDAIIRDFIPCYRKADGVAGMYDLVEGVFYTNKGTGTFIKGANYTIQPTPDNPIDIVNAGDKGLEVVVKGLNEICYEDKTARNDGTTSAITIFFSYAYELKPSTTYTLSFDYIFNELNGTPSFDIGRGVSWYNEDIAQSRAFPNLTQGRFKYTFTTPAELGDRKYLFFRLRKKSNEEIVDVTMTNIQLVIGDIDLPYMPYFEPTTLSIPSTIGDLELRFAKYDDTRKDSLIVDGVNKKVIYKQMLNKVIVPAESWNAQYYYSNSMGIYSRSELPYRGTRFKGFCSHATKKQVSDVQCYSAGGIWLGVNSQMVFWIGIITLLGYDSEWVDKANPTTAEWTAARDKFRAWLAEHEANGHPFECVYVMPTPIEHDITDTELGDQLLALAANKGTNILEITGATSLDVSYWRQVLPDEEI